jgi:hypothetical protein
MTVEISLYREVAPMRRCAPSVFREAHPGAVVDARLYKKNAPVALESASGTAPAKRSFVHPDERTCTRPGSSNVKVRTQGNAFGPQNTVARRGLSPRNLCTRPYFLVTWDAQCVPEEDHGMLRNKSHSRHVSAPSFTLDHRYTAVSIGDRLIDRAFVCCKNLRCKG